MQKEAIKGITTVLVDNFTPNLSYDYNTETEVAQEI